jgi:hypothetical protein
MTTLREMEIEKMRWILENPNLRDIERSGLTTYLASLLKEDRDIW